MSPKYKLLYFNSRGRAESARWILAYANIDYEDFRFDYAEWPKYKPGTNWGQAPVLEFDGIQLAQSGAITRFLGRRHGLDPETDVDRAKCDEYMDALGDMGQAVFKFYTEKDESKKAELRKEAVEVTIPQWFGKFEEILKKNGTGWVVGKKETYGDIALATGFEFYTKFLKEVDLAQFPELVKHCKKVQDLPGIKEWIQKRPDTTM